MSLRFLASVAIVTGTVAAPAVAADPAAPAQAQQTPRYDPNERICEDIQMIGSRIAIKRFCGTRAEWAEKQLQDRQEVEKAQMSPCVRQSTTGTGRASC